MVPARGWCCVGGRERARWRLVRVSGRSRVAAGAAWEVVVGPLAVVAGCAEEFSDLPGMTYLKMLEDALNQGGDGFFDCAHEMGVPEGAWTITVVFCIVVVLILLNMLIAMMSATFSEIWEDRDVDFIFSKAQRTLDIIDQPPAPPPLCALSLPYGAVSLVFGVVERLRKKIKGPDVTSSPRVYPKPSSRSSPPPSYPASPAPNEETG